MKSLSLFTCLAALIILLSGCSRAPEVDILGSFFPAWLICTMFSVPLTALVRWVLVRRDLEDYVGPLVVFYGSLSLAGSAALWFVFYR